MAETIKSNPVTNLDATPVVVATSGEGSPGFVRAAKDYCAATTSAAIWSSYRMSRFPTNAKVQRVWAYIKGVDGHSTATATFDFNVAFSDSAVDGTPQPLQGTIPSSILDGTAYALVATGYSTAYSSSGTGNKMFGASIAGSNVGAAQTAVDLTYRNTFTPVFAQDDLWDVFGFKNNAGAAQNPGGFFDILVVISAAVATAAVGTLGVEVDYIV